MKTTAAIGKIVVVTENKWGWPVESIYTYKGELLWNSDPDAGNPERRK